MSEETVGDAGPSTLGYYGGCFSPDARHILAYGYTGALHLWRRSGIGFSKHHDMYTRITASVAVWTCSCCRAQTIMNVYSHVYGFL